MKKINYFLFSKDEMNTRELFGGYLFWFAFLFEVICMVFKRLDYDLPQENYWLCVLAVCYGIKILCTKYSQKEWMIIAAFGLLSVVAFGISRQELIARVSLFILASKGIRKRSAIMIVYFSWLLSYVICIWQGCFGLVPFVITDDYGRGGIEKRYTFGFSHANMAHYSFWTAFSIACLLWDKLHRWWFYFAVATANVVLVYFTRSRTGFLITMLTIMGALLVHYLKQDVCKEFILRLGYLLLAGLLLICAIAIFDGENGKFAVVMTPLNNLLNMRIWQAGLLGQRASLYLFSPCTGVSDDFLTLNELVGMTDIGYIRTIYAYGVVYGILICLALLRILHLSIYSRYYYQGIFIMALMLYCFIESVQTDCIYTTQCLTWLLLLDCWYQPLERGLCTRKKEVAG